ncbi:uncharacterized protein CDV56_101788 [Aspergillus thermomutatus]|uniref:Uncharacterized protein n=1 Tax=Aspergillus thermomutatus TaxID=41047 RepID=A0A397GRD1_ASPTH|nr:uncharacterized protein CDV56_101788 [Aspergillus thermomutatus]RHZ53562.1 hypothetical protein CDV56_101788 [Aspergillus thermomutatus]
MPRKLVANFTCVINLDDHDDKEIKRAVLPRTAKKYDRSLMIFDRFLELHPAACSPPDIKTYKGFLEFYARNTPGRIEEKPTPETVENFRRDFETALARVRDFCVPKSMSITMKEYIMSDLKTKLGLPDAEMSRDGLSPNDLTILLTQLWCRDFKEYRGQYPDRSRVQLTASILLYCFSSARTGEVHESTARRSIARQKDGADDNNANLQASAMAACYKHFILTIELVDGIPMLVLTYAREFVKGYWRMKKWEPPVHAFYEVYREEVPLFFNLILFMLPLFSADRAFRHYKSYTEILDEVDSIKLSDLESQSNHVISRIHFRKDLLDTPVFRPFSELNCETSTGRARGADAFGKEFAALGYRSGYEQNVTARACRRWALMETDKKYSQTARMKYASHTEARTFGRSYAHPVCEVDGPATYLNIASRDEHIQNRRSMGIHRNPNLWQSLPAKAEFEFQEREDVMALDTEFAFLSAQLAKADSPEKAHEIHLQRRRVQSQKDKLYLEELKRQREVQQGTQTGSICEQTLFHYRRRAMPERDLLAQILPTKSTIRSSAGRDVMNALEAICSQYHPVTYRSGLRPVHGKFYAHRQWLHLYRCYHERLRQMSVDDFAEFCYECDLWFNNQNEWHQHCQDHLSKPSELLRCDPIIFRNCPVKPGYCPFCLGNTSLGPIRQMEQYLDMSKWKEVLTIGRDHRAFSLKQGQGSLPNALKVCKETGVQEVAVWECSLAENNKAIMEGLQRHQVQGRKMSHVRIMRQTEGSEQSNGIGLVDAALSWSIRARISNWVAAEMR